MFFLLMKVSSSKPPALQELLVSKIELRREAMDRSELAERLSRAEPIAGVNPKSTKVSL